MYKKTKKLNCRNTIVSYNHFYRHLVLIIFVGLSVLLLIDACSSNFYRHGYISSVSLMIPEIEKTICTLYCSTKKHIEQKEKYERLAGDLEQKLYIYLALIPFFNENFINENTTDQRFYTQLAGITDSILQLLFINEKLGTTDEQIATFNNPQPTDNNPQPTESLNEITTEVFDSYETLISKNCYLEKKENEFKNQLETISDQFSTVNDRSEETSIREHRLNIIQHMKTSFMKIHDIISKIPIDETIVPSRKKVKKRL